MFLFPLLLCGDYQKSASFEGYFMTARITRFAPSPTGHLHLGHIYAALWARQRANEGRADKGRANETAGKMLLRIEDIDHTRCRPPFYDLIFDDLDFLGIAYDGEVWRQSERLDIYQNYLDDLHNRGLVYPCYLSRRELDGLLSAPHNTDTALPPSSVAERIERGENPAWRLRMEAIIPLISGLTYSDHSGKRYEIAAESIGDVVIARKDIGTSYHLAAVIDDGLSGVTLVTRGADLLGSTPLHRILQHLLGFPEVVWDHHPLITDDAGNRLAKRAASQSIQQYRSKGLDRRTILSLLPPLP